MGFLAAEQAQTASAKRVMAGLAMAFLVFSLAGCGGSTPTAKVVSQTISGPMTMTTESSVPGAGTTMSGTISMAMDADSGAISEGVQATTHAARNISVHLDVRNIYDPKDRNFTQFTNSTTTVPGAPPIVQISCTWHVVQPGLAIGQAALGLLTSHLRAISASTPPTPGGLSPVPCDKSPMDCLRDQYANMTYKGADGDNSVFNLDMHLTAPTPATGSITIHEEFTFDPDNLMRKVAYSMATSVPMPDKSIMKVTSKTDMTMVSAKGGKPDASSFDVPLGWPACVPAPEATATAHKTTAVTQQKAIVV